MFGQTQITPNPNSLKFIPDKKVSNSGSFEITNKDEINNDLVRNIFSINGVTGIFLGEDFLSVNKTENTNWEDVKHVVISLINEFYSDGNEFVINKNVDSKKKDDFSEFKEKLSDLLVEKISPISKEIKRLLNDAKYLDNILLEGSQKADRIASIKIKEIKKKIGI